MIPQEMVVAKAEVESTVAELWQFVAGAAREATAAHLVEEQLFRKLLALGRQLYSQFLALQGTGDVGEHFALPDGRQLQRLENTHQRPLQTIFGEFSLDRAVYGTREGQAIEAVPLDARLQLPDSKFSHLLQSWDQLVATEQPYGQVSKVMEMILGVSQHVDSLERMSRGMAASAEEFCWSQPAPPAAEEGEILVESADGKGVPIRHAAEAPPIRDHQHCRGPKPDRKRMATVAAVYSVDRFVRTPEQVLEALFHDPQVARPDDLPQRPRPQHKRTYARLDDDPNLPNDPPVNGAAAAFGWLEQQVRARLATRSQPVEVVCVMDGQPSLYPNRRSSLAAPASHRHQPTMGRLPSIPYGTGNEPLISVSVATPRVRMAPGGVAEDRLRPFETCPHYRTILLARACFVAEGVLPIILESWWF